MMHSRDPTESEGPNRKVVLKRNADARVIPSEIDYLLLTKKKSVAFATEFKHESRSVIPEVEFCCYGFLIGALGFLCRFGWR